MAGNRREWHERMKAVEREWRATAHALAHFLTEHESGRAKLAHGTKVRDVQAAIEHLEATYLVRLFAEFESGLRNWYATHKDTVPPVRDLIDAVAARRNAPDELREEVHEVREYRNALVHETDAPIPPVSLEEAGRRLGAFFARLPEKW